MTSTSTAPMPPAPELTRQITPDVILPATWCARAPGPRQTPGTPASRRFDADGRPAPGEDGDRGEPARIALCRIGGDHHHPGGRLRARDGRHPDEPMGSAGGRARPAAAAVEHEHERHHALGQHVDEHQHLVEHQRRRRHQHGRRARRRAPARARRRAGDQLDEQHEQQLDEQHHQLDERRTSSTSSTTSSTSSTTSSTSSSTAP